jgi:hypothetical protein
MINHINHIYKYQIKKFIEKLRNKNRKILIAWEEWAFVPKQYD